MTRVLVTGGLGYLGSILCEHLLEAGYKVTALDNFLHDSCRDGLFHLGAHDKFRFIEGDIRDESVMRESLRDADVIVHLASIVGAPACDRDPEGATSVNVGAVKLLRRLLSDHQLVLYSNTNSGYGINGGKDFCTEESPLTPISLYGRTKIEAETILLGHPHTIAFRLATLFGMSPRMRFDLLVNHFVHAALNEGHLVLFEKDFRRNFVHVRDVADCMIHGIKNATQMSGRAYNVGLDEANLSKEQLARKVKQHVPDFNFEFAPVGFDPDKRDYIVSSARLHATGFRPRRSLDDGIRELIEGYTTATMNQCVMNAPCS